MPAEKKAKIKFNNAYHKSLSAVLRKIHTNVQNNRDLINKNTKHININQLALTNMVNNNSTIRSNPKSKTKSKTKSLIKSVIATGKKKRTKKHHKKRTKKHHKKRTKKHHKKSTKKRRMMDMGRGKDEYKTKKEQPKPTKSNYIKLFKLKKKLTRRNTKRPAYGRPYKTM